MPKDWWPWIAVEDGACIHVGDLDEAPGFSMAQP